MNHYGCLELKSPSGLHQFDYAVGAKFRGRLSHAGPPSNTSACSIYVVRHSRVELQRSREEEHYYQSITKKEVFLYSSYFHYSNALFITFGVGSWVVVVLIVFTVWWLQISIEMMWFNTIRIVR